MNNQITPYACGLACLESIFDDFGIGISQAEMMIRFKNELLQGLRSRESFGSVNLVNVQYLVGRLGIKFKAWKDHDKLSMGARLTTIGKQEGVIVGMTINGQHHMAKAEKPIGETLPVVEPSFDLDQPKSETYSFDQLISFDFEDWHFSK